MYSELEQDIEGVVKCIVNTENGKLKSLDDLTSFGRRLFCIFIHLLLKKSRKQNHLETFLWLKLKKQQSRSIDARQRIFQDKLAFLKIQKIV